MKADRRPLYADQFSSIKWEKHGTRLRLDPEVTALFKYSVYRYATIAEALALLDGQMTFATPSKWQDKYESHLADQLFAAGKPLSKAVPFVKCFSVDYSSEAMWRTYSGPGGIVRMSIKLPDLIAGLDQSELPKDIELYVGRVRYMEPKKIRTEIDALKKSSSSVRRASTMAALLMKRQGFSFENEIRIAFTPRAKRGSSSSFSVQGFPITAMSRMLLDPYLPEWQTEELKKLFKMRLAVPFKVHRSSFNAHPVDLEDHRA
ncbi:MAG: DUF2971 domain-containing protein [Proteobacteria bacterium]|nr:DUF2971 domain-containing protein [Pseudomonadota bacterium]